MTFAYLEIKFTVTKRLINRRNIQKIFFINFPFDQLPFRTVVSIKCRSTIRKSQNFLLIRLVFDSDATSLIDSDVTRKYGYRSVF